MKIGDIRLKCLLKVDNWLITALSDGHITVWELNGSQEPVENCSLFLDCRVTCMACNNYFRYYLLIVNNSNNLIYNNLCNAYKRNFIFIH